MSGPADELRVEAGRRRTFAIISHPDAGKTTLTEKLLLYGGAVRLAGSVKQRRAERHATSDWMALERERGISIATSVMQFPYRDFELNLLDTPGHNDFSEDTYRTLAAADCAVMLIDSAKGVEPQTIKLFQVCRARQLPIVTFINKLDRHGREPLDLLDEIERVLDMPCTPLNWPIGAGPEFQGVYDLDANRLLRFERGESASHRAIMQVSDLDDAALTQEIGTHAHHQLLDEIALLHGAGTTFDLATFRAGNLLAGVLRQRLTNSARPFSTASSTCPAAAPAPHAAGDVGSGGAVLSGLSLKIQANMDPQHRDRIASCASSPAVSHAAWTSSTCAPASR
jgi:peptide chain release factor 3